MVKDIKTTIVGGVVGVGILLTIFCCEGKVEEVPAVEAAPVEAVEEVIEEVTPEVEEVAPAVEEVIPTEKVASNNEEDSVFLMPTPVNLEVNMSILARYMSDVDQIISNFVPYSNPYIILSWKVPSVYGANYTQEIRSEVLWSGELAYTTPTDTTYSDKFRITVDTSFTIKGWLFPEQKDTVPVTFKVDNNIFTVDLKNRMTYGIDPGVVLPDVVTTATTPLPYY